MPVLTLDQIERINRQSFGLLETVGLRLGNERVQSMLLARGARPGDRSGMLRLPRSLVEESLHAAPRVVELASLDGSSVELTADGPSVFWTVNALSIADGKTIRPIDEKAFIDICRVAQHCPNVHATVAPAISDYPPHHRDFVGLRLLAENTTKHLRPCIYTPDGTLAVREMGEVLAGGAALRDRPVYSLGFTSVSPLTWSPMALEVFIKSSGAGVPIMVNAEPIAGATGPVTLAGTLALANAEALGGLTILQLLEPGRPCVFNLGFSHVMDMRTTVTRTGSPECALMQAAGAELARSHGLPSASWASTESLSVDGQACYEKVMTGLMHILSTVNIIWGIGQLEAQRTVSLPQMVIDDEIAGALYRLQRGIEVTEETLAFATIAELGPGADYLGHEHTLSHFRTEVHYGSLTWTDRRERWEQAGQLDLTTRAEARVAEILAGSPPCQLPEDVRRRLAAIQAKWMARANS
ncbi:MAG: trimethylamine methyltransferase family protein [Candidatus Latescibacterota bacterium]|jgi:trimethylamine--corrinoid protein Co-methyltransferase